MKSFPKYFIFFLLAILVGAAGMKGYEYFYPEKEEAKESHQTKTPQEETKIINEIKTNEPSKTTTTTTTSTTNSEIKNTETVKSVEPTVTNPSDKDLISLYYNKLSEGDYQGAYDMKKYKTMDFSVFKGWYTNLKSTQFLDFIEVAPHQYDFIVELTNKDDSKENYRVWMQVEGNLLNTMSSNSTDEKTALRFVYGEDGDITTLLLAQNGNKTTIDTAKASKYEKFNNVEITSGGDYLLYFKTGIEWNYGKIYDIKQNKVVHEITEPGIYGFTSDWKHFYNCSASGMASGDVSVYSVPSFELEKDLSQSENLIFSCEGYDKNANTLKYTLSTNGFKNQHPYSYNFSTGEVNNL